MEDKLEKHKIRITDLTVHFVKYFTVKLDSYFKCIQGDETRRTRTEATVGAVTEMSTVAFPASSANFSLDFLKWPVRKFGEHARRDKARSVLDAFGYGAEDYNESALSTLLVDIMIEFLDAFRYQLEILNPVQYKSAVENITKDLVHRLFRGIHEMVESEKLQINYTDLLSSADARDAYSNKIIQYFLFGKSKLQHKQQFLPKRGYKIMVDAKNDFMPKWTTTGIFSETAIYKLGEYYKLISRREVPKYSHSYGYRLSVKWEDLTNRTSYAVIDVPVVVSPPKKRLKPADTKPLRRQIVHQLGLQLELVRIPAPTFPYHSLVNTRDFIKSLMEKRSCVIYGPAGSGKTEFLHHFIRNIVVPRSLFKIIVCLNANTSHFELSVEAAAQDPKLEIDPTSLSAVDVFRKIVRKLGEEDRDCCIVLDGLEAGSIDTILKIIGTVGCSKKFHTIILCTARKEEIPDLKISFLVDSVQDNELEQLFHLYCFPKSDYRTISQMLIEINTKIAGNTGELIGILAAIRANSCSESEFELEMGKYLTEIQNCTSLQEIFEKRLDYIMRASLLSERAVKLLLFLAHLDTDRLSMNVFDFVRVKNDLNSLEKLRILHCDEDRVRIAVRTQFVLREEVKRRRNPEQVLRNNLKLIEVAVNLMKKPVTTMPEGSAPMNLVSTIHRNCINRNKIKFETELQKHLTKV